MNGGKLEGSLVHHYSMLGSFGASHRLARRQMWLNQIKSKSFLKWKQLQICHSPQDLPHDRPIRCLTASLATRLQRERSDWAVTCAAALVFTLKTHRPLGKASSAVLHCSSSTIFTLFIFLWPFPLYIFFHSLRRRGSLQPSEVSRRTGNQFAVEFWFAEEHLKTACTISWVACWQEGALLRWTFPPLPVTAKQVESVFN